MAEHGVAQIWRKIPAMYNIIGNHCTTCNSYYFPPRPVCPKCRRKGHLEDHKFKGLGIVHTFAIVRQAPDDFKTQAPYIVAQVQLDEGPKLTTQIVNCNIEDVYIDMRVRACFRKITEFGHAGLILYGFKFEPTMKVTGHPDR